MIKQPDEIERESMRIIQNLIADRSSIINPDNLPVIKRVIHATADFDFLDTLYFSEGVISQARAALRNSVPIITDTLMLASGISKVFTSKYNVKVICKVSDDDTISQALSRKVTRSVINIERAVKDYPQAIYAIGNAPTALMRLCELIRAARAKPALVIGVPVGFVNVIEAKELLYSLDDTPKILAHGRKGGTTVACAIINAILYGM